MDSCRLWISDFTVALMLMHQNQTSFSSQKISPDKLRFAEVCEKCGNKYQEKCKYASMINFIDKMLQKNWVFAHYAYSDVIWQLWLHKSLLDLVGKNDIDISRSANQVEKGICENNFLFFEGGCGKWVVYDLLDRISFILLSLSSLCVCLIWLC